MNLAQQRSIVEMIYRSGYFTNHGPLAQKLEKVLQDYFSISNAVVVSNESLAVIMALAGLDLTGRVEITGDCPDYLVQAASRAGMEVAHAPATAAGAAPTVHFMFLPPEPFSPAGPTEQSKRNGGQLVLFHSGWPVHRPLVTEAITIVVLGGRTVSPSAHCAAILTSDDVLAEKYRNIRSSYGVRKPVDVRATANGRVSEFQAGMALLFLQNLEAKNP